MSQSLSDGAGSPSPAPTRVAESLGLSFLARRAFSGDRLTETWDELLARYGRDPADAGALLDLSTLVQMKGERDKGLELQAAAIAACRCYRTVHGAGRGLRILALMTPGDLMANTPLDFLFEGSDAQVISYYVDGALPSPAELPDHDIAFMAISQSEAAPEALARLPAALDAWPRPVLNGHPARIAELTRDGVAARFAGHPKLVCPPTRRIDRATLLAVASGAARLDALHPELAYPIILRPLASHAGKGLERIDDGAALGAYLSEHAEDEAFFAAKFFDYSGPDGLFRKLRVVFVEGRPYLAHMAISARWMVHYLNADMGEPGHRAAEAEMMASFADGFAARHAEAFAALTEGFGLDYYGIDCAETQDGRLVVFEADVAMLVHDMDPVELYPYKKPAMARLFAGFREMVEATAARRRLAA
jgi:hypothetical protein